MHDAIAKADVLIEALGWIRRFRGKTIVVKLGGNVLEDEDALRHILLDVVFMETVGLRPVLVHGAGSAITRAMDAAGLKSRFVRGRRVTDDAALEIVERVLAEDLNDHVVNEIARLGGQAQGLNFRSQCVLYGQELIERDVDGESVDLGHVGDITRVDVATLKQLAVRGLVPVIPSMCFLEGTSQKLNVNADTAASAVAEALHAEKLMFLSDVNGVRARKDEPDSLIDTLNARQAQSMIASGQVEKGMIPKVEGCLKTLDRGVGKVHIVDGRLRHSLLLEIFTNKGVGTQFISEDTSNKERVT